MQFKGIYINNDFLSVFTPKEFEQILPYSFAFDNDSFAINTEEYFFEVTVSAKKVTISYDANFSDNGGVISKDTFLKLLEESPVQYPEIVEV
ncbi:MAG: hypothetical protein GXP61_04290 [Epsilonproteobacteria bacterium]|nr:hypothetical protein [Campylobacterota bacterium]